jgi:hypothetical protein
MPETNEAKPFLICACCGEIVSGTDEEACQHLVERHASGGSMFEFTLKECFFERLAPTRREIRLRHGMTAPIWVLNASALDVMAMIGFFFAIRAIEASGLDLEAQHAETEDKMDLFWACEQCGAVLVTPDGCECLVEHLVDAHGSLGEFYECDMDQSDPGHRLLPTGRVFGQVQPDGSFTISEVNPLWASFCLGILHVVLAGDPG